MANDLDRIQRMIEGEQRLAAIEKIDALLKKHPEKTALLMLKAEVYFQLNEIEKVEPIIAQVLELEPSNPSALAMRVLITITNNGTVVEVLTGIQHALHCVESLMTRVVYDALYATIVFLISNGYPFSAKGYLQFAVMVSDNKDPRCISLLNQLNRSNEMPFLLREHIDSGARPQNVTWAREFDVAMAIAAKGVWSQARDMLRSMSYRVLDEPAILRNLAIILALNAENELAAKTFRQFAELRRINELDRVHAEALASVLDPKDRMIDIVQIVYPVDDAEKAMEVLLSTAEAQKMPVPQSENDQPPPKGVFELLDKAVPGEEDELTAENLPCVLGNLVLFGKQTDREARLEALIPRSNQFDSTIARITEILGDLLGEASDPEPVASSPRFITEIVGSVRFPDSAKREKREELVNEIRTNAIMNKWVDSPAPELKNKTPREAATDQELRIPLLAELLSFEISNEVERWGMDLNELYSKLSLEPVEKIDLSKRPIQHVPVSHMGRLNIEEMSDDDLIAAYRYAFAVFGGGILYKLALEISKRDSMHDKIDRVEIFDVLSDLSLESDEALEWLEKARKLATSQGESPAHWMIDEMQIRLIRGEASHFENLFREVQNRYMKEPGVAQALMSMLQKFGLITPDGKPMTPPPGGQPEEMVEQTVPAEADKLWTPGDTAADSSQGESKLWIPD